jgi:threonine dehydrogenase-like Zn-dependent dehydrogenase
MKALLCNATVPNYLALKLLGRISKKFFFSGPFATLRIKEIPEPKPPNQHWVKIKTRPCGFCGSDINFLTMKDSLMASPFTSFPCIFGHEVCGEVVETGRAVNNCAGGNMVTLNPALSCDARGIDPECPVCAAGRPGSCERFAEGAFAPGMFTGICKDVGGGFAEYMVVHKSQVYRVPHGVNPESVSLTEPLAVGIQAVLDNKPAEADRVPVIGGGVIGSMIVKAIRGFDIGCTVVVVEPSAFNAEYVRRCGADHVIPGRIVEAAEKFTVAKAYKPMTTE